MEQTSTLILSLDFELFWGMADKETLKSYGPRILGGRGAIPRILELFSEYNLHATWAVVGFVLFEKKSSLLAALPKTNFRPTYADGTLSTYRHIEQSDIGEDEARDPYHFGASLVRLIQGTPNQEIASHTFSHYYCLDGEKNGDEIFDADCRAFAAIASTFGLTPRSIVFPRNQASASALGVCKKNGITSFRGTEDHFLYRPRKDEEQSLLVRGLRLLDHYVNLSGHHTYDLNKTQREPIINIPASRFLRPHNKMFAFLEPLRLRRIKRSMTHAAQHGETFHLWWHPHNFGADLERNMRNLRDIAEHYKKLHAEFGMESLTMKEAAAKLQV